MLNLCIKTFDLILGTLEDFMGECPGKADHQVRSAQLVLQTARRFNEDFRTTFVLFAQVFILTFHTFISG